jgi:hypothetical protein
MKGSASQADFTLGTHDAFKFAGRPPARNAHLVRLAEGTRAQLFPEALSH